MLSRKHCRLPKPSADRQTLSPVPVQDRATMSSVRRKETSSAPPSSSDIFANSYSSLWSEYGKNGFIIGNWTVFVYSFLKIEVMIKIIIHALHAW